MREYHHIGIPTTEKRPGEVHLKHLKIFVSGYGKSPYNIEWTRYEVDAPYPEIVKTVAHVACARLQQERSAFLPASSFIPSHTPPWR